MEWKINYLSKREELEAHEYTGIVEWVETHENPSSLLYTRIRLLKYNKPSGTNKVYYPYILSVSGEKLVELAREVQSKYEGVKIFSRSIYEGKDLETMIEFLHELKKRCE